MIFVVIPTYNELHTVEQLVRSLFATLPSVSVLIVDDSSPDGTSVIIKRLQGEYSSLHLLERPVKSGLGPAYLEGFAYALQHDATIIVQMDADMSHDPAAIPQLLEQLEKADVVLGSRYVAGGLISNWSLIRRMISRFGNLYARYVLQLSYKDLTGGYKCYKEKVVRALLAQTLSSVGYNFQIETTYFAHKLGYKIVEYPITFSERTQGTSKFSLAIFIESFIAVLRLRFK